MSKLFQCKAFKSGFLAGIMLSALIHLINFIEIIQIEEPVSSKISIGLVYYFGFPFPIFEWNHYSPIDRQFHFAGLVGNIFVTLVGSFVIGLIFKFIWSKISPHSINLK